MICFVERAEKWFGGTMRREQRGGYMDANEEAKKKNVKTAADGEQKYRR